MDLIPQNKSDIDFIPILKNIPEFSLLDTEHLKSIASVVNIEDYPARSIVFRENEMGDAFYIIISGEVETFVTNTSNVDVTLLSLFSMDSLGEIGFITGKPRAASAKAVIDSKLLVIKKNDFDEVLDNDPALTKTFINILGNRLKTDNERAIEQSNKAHELKQFWVEKGTLEPITLIGRSKHIQELKEFSQKSAENKLPVFFIGEKGTGKIARAQYIFENSNRKHERYLTVDCASIQQINAKIEDGDQSTNDILLEIAQESTLFGHLKGSLPFAKTRRLGYIEVAESGTIVIDNIEKLTLVVQNKMLAYIKSGFYKRIGSDKQIKSDVKLIFTCNQDIDDLVKNGKFDKDLYDHLMRQSMVLIPLRERKKDIHDLVDHFLKKFSKLESKNDLTITKEAMHLLLEYEWPNNIDQLSGAIRRAVSLAEDNRVTSSQIFLGSMSNDNAKGINLLKLSFLRKFLESKLFPDTFRNVIATIYISVILLLLFGFHGYDKTTVVVVWAIGWPVMLVCAPFVSRLFCGLCPMRTIAEKIQSRFNLNLKLPDFIKNYGPFMGLFGFTVILSSEYILDMYNDPLSTALLFLSILGFAVIFSLLFVRATWCRHICPLGQMNGVFSKLSIIEIRANTSVCNSECRRPSCYAGVDKQKGCPMSLGVFNLFTNENCIVCGQCIKNCQHKSVRINLRVPAAEIVSDSGLNSYRRGANLAIAFFVPVLISGVIAMNFAKLSIYHQLPIGIDNEIFHYMFFYLFFYAVSLSLIWSTVKYTGTREKDSNTERFIWYSCSFIPVAFAGEIANQIITFIKCFGLIVPEVLLQFASHKFIILNHQESTAVVKALQVSIVIAGAIISSYFGKRVIDKESQSENSRKYRVVYAVNAAIAILLLLVFILRA